MTNKNQGQTDKNQLYKVFEVRARLLNGNVDSYQVTAKNRIEARQQIHNYLSSKGQAYITIECTIKNRIPARSNEMKFSNEK